MKSKIAAGLDRVAVQKATTLKTIYLKIERNRFIKSKFTIQAKKYCVLVSLDVKNVFNMVNWSKILKELERSLLQT